MPTQLDTPTPTYPIVIRIPHLAVTPPRDHAGMVLEAAAGDGQKVDTYDWDTVFAIKFSDANKSLAKPGATPTDFISTDSETGVTASGKFSPWQLSGGDGTLLHMAVPIASGSMTGFRKQTYDLAGAIATLEIELKDLPQPALSNGTPHKLVADPSKTLSVTDLTNVPGKPGTTIISIMKGLLEEWFNKKLAQFTHAFSTVTLNEKADKDQFQWLKPTALGWAVSKQGAEPVFGVLCMTSGRTAPGTMQISPNAIPSGQKSGFLISQERFLEKVLLPGVYTMFDKAKAEDFEVINDGTMIHNKNAVNLEPVQIDASHYTPTLPPNHVQITMEATRIVVQLKEAAIGFSPGIVIKMSYTGYSRIELATNSKGEQVLNYYKKEKVDDPIVDHHVEVADWVTWTEVAASVTAVVATLGGAQVMREIIENIVYRVIAIIIIGLTAQLIANIAGIINAVAAGKKDDLPPVDLMIINATSPVKWPDSTDFQLTSAELNESLQLGGDPKFVN